VEAVVIAHLHDDAFVPREDSERLELRRRARGGLLDDDVLARLDGDGR
jgi:hypothetical protein